MGSPDGEPWRLRVQGLRPQTSRGKRFDAVAHRARLATPYPAAMPARRKGSGGAGQSAVLPRLDNAGHRLLRGVVQLALRRFERDPREFFSTLLGNAFRATTAGRT